MRRLKFDYVTFLAERLVDDDTMKALAQDLAAAERELAEMGSTLAETRELLDDTQQERDAARAEAGRYREALEGVCALIDDDCRLTREGKPSVSRVRILFMLDELARAALSPKEQAFQQWTIATTVLTPAPDQGGDDA